jgi:hypothetical protein
MQMLAKRARQDTEKAAIIDRDLIKAAEQVRALIAMTGASRR